MFVLASVSWPLELTDLLLMVILVAPPAHLNTLLNDLAVLLVTCILQSLSTDLNDSIILAFISKETNSTPALAWLTKTI
jgi:hypothetical protein